MHLGIIGDRLPDMSCLPQVVGQGCKNPAAGAAGFRKLAFNMGPGEANGICLGHRTNIQPGDAETAIQLYKSMHKD